MFVVTSVTGHMTEEDFSPEYQSWQNVDAGSLFDARIITKVSSPDIAETLRIEASNAYAVGLWLDGDREGENIAFEVLDVCRKANPRIIALRALFSALTPRDIHNALRGLVQPNKPLSDAVALRRECDLRIGAAFTRTLTLALREYIVTTDRAVAGVALMQSAPNHRGRRKEEGGSNVVSFGPCQIPTLAFVVNRALQREAFVPRPYWALELHCATAPKTDSMPFKWERVRLYSEAAVHALTTAMLAQLPLTAPPGSPTLARDGAGASVHPTARDCDAQLSVVVTNVTSRVERRPRPFPLATVPLQQLSSRHLRLPAERTMQLANDLYRGGFISYPRTETDSFTATDDELRALIQPLADAQHAPWAQHARAILAGDGSGIDRLDYVRPRRGAHDDKAHPPIHPTKVARPGELDGDAARVYELVVRAFLAACSPDAVGGQDRIEVAAGGAVHAEKFFAIGRTLRQRGWLAVWPWERWHDRSVPSVTRGQHLHAVALMLAEGTTTPPELLQESELIALMDRNGIGTDATIAQHIATIQRRAYAVQLANGRFAPTPLGRALVTAFDHLSGTLQMSLTDPDLRAQMEHDMGEVAKGAVSLHTARERVLARYKGVYSVLRGALPRLTAAVAEMLASARTARVDGGDARGGSAGDGSDDEGDGGDDDARGPDGRGLGPQGYRVTRVGARHGG